MIDYLPTDYPKLNCRKVNSAISKIARKNKLSETETWSLFQKYAGAKSADIHTLTDAELAEVVTKVTSELESRK